MAGRAHIQRKKSEAAEAELRPQPEVAAAVADRPPLELVAATLAAETQPLDGGAREALEPALGHDFAEVRVHSDDHAAASARALGARAYTVGRDVVFGAGEYSPNTADGRRLIAHELAHVAQQRAAPAPPAAGPLTISRPDDPFEREADRAAEGVVALRAPAALAPTVAQRPGAPPQIQLKAASPSTPTQGAGDQDRLQHVKGRALEAQQQALAGQAPPDLSDLAAGQAGEGAAEADTDRADQGSTGESRVEADALKKAATSTAGSAGETAEQTTVGRPQGAAATPDLKASPAAADTPAQTPPSPAQAPPSPAQAPAAGQGTAAAAAREASGATGGTAPAASGAAVAADQAASLADDAAAVAVQPDAPAAPEVSVAPVAPVDAGGEPLPADPETDEAILDLAEQARAMREGAGELQKQGAAVRGGAATMRSQLAQVQQGVSQADQGIQTSQDHLAFRRSAVGTARQALATSEQKADMVAEQAPAYVAKAAEGKQKSGPIAGEARQLESRNAANTPKDSEAAARSREQGQKFNKVGSDTESVDGAMSQAHGAAETLVADAAKARQTNTQTRGKIDAAQATLDQTDQRLGQMQRQTGQTRAQLEAVAEQPGELAEHGAGMAARGEEIHSTSLEIESRLHEVQAAYAADMRSVPAQPPREEHEEAGAPELDSAMAEPEPAAAPEGASAEAELAPEPEGNFEAPLLEPVDLTSPAATIAAQTSAPAGVEPEPERLPAPEAREVALPAAAPATGAAEPEPLNLEQGLRQWATGKPDETAEQREARRDEAEQRRREQVEAIGKMAGKPFEQLSAGEKAGIASRLMWQNLTASAGKMEWPSFGQLAVGLIDPRGPLSGVLGGLSMMANGVMTMAREPSWGNLLKMAADLATGLTIILGSITALAALIIGLMTALTILSFGIAAAATGPIIAFCATVMTTVGGWTLTVGWVALALQGLLFIKNLYQAATAESADELQRQSDNMTQDVSNAGNVVMQMGMAKLSQVGGRALQSEISAAGGGVRFAARMGVRGAAAPGQALRAARSMGVRGMARSAGGAIRALPGRVGRAAMGMGRRGMAAARALPGRIASGIRGLPGRIAQFPGRMASGARALPGRLREGLRRGFGRDYLVGENVGPGLKGWNTAAKQGRAAGHLELMGLDKQQVARIPHHEMPQVRESFKKWNTRGDGRNQGVVHILDYSKGTGGAAKANRLDKINEYTGLGPFDANDPLVALKTTEALDELCAMAEQNAAQQVRQVGGKTMYFFPKGGTAPGATGFTQSQKGMIIMKFEGKYSTFMNSKYKDFLVME